MSNDIKPFEFGAVRVRDIIEHRVNVGINAADPIIIDPRGFDYYFFTPRTLVLAWDWQPGVADMVDGFWELTTLAVRGLRLNKNGSVNARRIYVQKDYKHAGKISIDCPAQFIELVTKHFPTWKPVPLA